MEWIFDSSACLQWRRPWPRRRQRYRKNQCLFSLSVLLPRPPPWITLGKPKSEQERGCDVRAAPASPLIYFPELLLVFGGEKVQICLIVPLLPVGLAGSPPPSHLLKTTQTPTSVVSFLHFCFSPFW